MTGHQGQGQASAAAMFVRSVFGLALVTVVLMVNLKCSPAMAHAMALAEPQYYGSGGGHYHQAVPARFPPGVSPHACPNYPYCHNGAGYGHHGGYAGGHGYGGGHYGGGAGYGHHGAGIGAGAKYPAHVNPASCPNYPYCHNNPGGGHYGGHGGYGGGYWGKK